MKKITHIQLMVSVVKQGNRYIAYSPALDFSTSGRSEKEARKRFAEGAMLVIEELEKAGTMHDVLRELGWHQGRKQWSPPKIISQEAIGLRLPVAA